MDFLILLGGVVALVWGAVLFWRGGLIAGALAVLLAGICFGHPFFNAPLGPLPVTIDRVLLGLLVVLTIVYRRFGWTSPIEPTAADWSLIAFTGVVALSTLAHDWRVSNSLPLAHYVFLYLLPLAFYWVMRQAAVPERAVWGTFLVLGAFGIYLAVTSIAETHGLSALVYPKYISSRTYAEFYGRGRGPLLNPAGSGILQGLCLAGALMWWPRLSRRGQLLLLGLMPIYAWGIYCTLTRSVWMGALLGLTIIVGLTLPRVWRVPMIAVLLLGSLPLAAANWEQLLAFKRDKDLSATEAAESAKLRPILALVAWNMFQDHPWFGCGYGQYTIECKPYLADRSSDLPLEKARPYVQHNAFLALLVETGLLGAGLFTATLALWLRRAWRLWQAPNAPPGFRQCGLLFMAFFGVWVVNAMFHDVLIIPMVNMLLFFSAALTVNLSQCVLPERATAPALMPQPAFRPARASS